ncbi:MAG: hypothetical protein ACK4OM_01650 [Alphaproteobacteria bacterium]
MANSSYNKNNLKSTTSVIANSILKAATINGISMLILTDPSTAISDAFLSVPAYMARGFAREYMDHPNVKWALGEYSNYLPYVVGLSAGGIKAGIASEFTNDSVLPGAFTTLSYEITSDLDYNTPLDSFKVSLAIDVFGSELTRELKLHLSEDKVYNHSQDSGLINNLGHSILGTAIFHGVINSIYIPLANIMNEYIDNYFVDTAMTEYSDYSTQVIGDINYTNKTEL